MYSVTVVARPRMFMHSWEIYHLQVSTRNEYNVQKHIKYAETIFFLIVE